ncbi:MAG TPA: M20/M25/M40 family metallo-hydrolase, partial [Bacteroidia bacterium]|nr:M20/M25/M40 family metallo-hydrolase [Bacteroidia bacterium]
LAGSAQAGKAVDFCFQTLSKLHPDTVYLQECMVPHWVRGEKEKAKMMRKGAAPVNLSICALGGSVATPAPGISAAVVEVHNLDEINFLGEKGIKGKIVFFNRPFDKTLISTFEAYGGAVDQRWAGPSRAAQFGAVATVCRSMTPDINDYPHTGSMRYNDSFPQIPCCAVSTWGAEQLSQALKSDPALKLWFRQTCKTLPDVKSYNVIAELRGSQFPDQIIDVGGHLDSWETGDGASDDGTGIVQSMEIIRLFKALGIRPKRTIRAVMFMNEENGTRGGKAYAQAAKDKNEHHILALESDRGGFTPRGFSTEMDATQKNKIISWQPFFLPYGIYDFTQTGGGSDIDPLRKMLNVPLMELIPDPQRYFDIHHTPQDKFSMISRRELELGGAGMASMIYLLSEYGL